MCGVEGQESGQDQSLIIKVWVSSSENPESKHLTHALLDCQSNATFITETLKEELEIEGVKVPKTDIFFYFLVRFYIRF